MRAGNLELLDRVRTATSIEKPDSNYRDKGVDPNDKQILFYDISQLRMGIGTEVKKIKEKFFTQAKDRLEKASSQVDLDQEQFKKDQKQYLTRLKAAFELINGLPITEANSKLRELFAKDNLEEDLKEILLKSNTQVREVFESRVASFLKKQNLTGTTQLYLNGAEEFKTDLGYEILQEIVKQIKKANGGGDFNLAAIANFNYSHGPDKSLEAVFSHPIYLRTPRQYQLDERINPEIKSLMVRSLPKRRTTTSQDIATVTKTTSFNNALAKRIQTRLVNGDQRIFLRAHSNESLSALKDSFMKEGSNISYGWIEENTPYYVDDKGIKHELASPAQLLAQWGQGFKVLMHSGYFDRLEEPADTVITATKVKSPDKLEELITPLYTLRTNPSKKAHLIYYKFGKLDSNDLNDQNPDYLLEQIALRHTKNGNNVRQLSSSSGLNFRGSSVGASSDVSEAEAYYEQQWARYSEPVKHFWLNAFGSTTKLRNLIASYVRERDQKNLIVGDTALFNDELDYVWDLLNNRTIPDSSATFEHKRREVFESLFRQMNKTSLLRDYIAQYPSLLGIETQRDAQDRVTYVYKQINNEINRSKDPILTKMDKLFTGNLTYETKQSHRSNLIGEFLYTQGQNSILEEQILSADASKFENTRLQNAILKLTGALASEANDELVVAFREFITQKLDAKQKLEENTRLGISRKVIRDLVENYLVENEADFIDSASSEACTDREDYLVNTAADLDAIDGDNDKFYRYLCNQTGGPDLKRVLELNPDLICVKEAQELKIVINNLKLSQNHNDKNVISNWQAKFNNMDGEFLLASFILEKKPELVKVASRKDLIKTVELLTGAQRLASKDEQTEFRSFIDFIYKTSPKQISTAVSGKGELSADQVSLAIAKENPGLMGVVSRDQLESMLKKVLNDQIKKLSSQDHGTAKFNSLSNRDYQKLVIKLVNEADLNTIAASFGITDKDLVEQFFPEGLKNVFESNYLNIVDEANRSSRDIAKLEKNWNSVWESRAVFNVLAKSLIIEKLFDKDFKDPDFKYGISTRVASADGKSFMIFNRNKLSYREYINAASNAENISSSGLEDLAFSWSCNSDLATGELGSCDYLPVWRANMLLGVEDAVKERLAEFKQSQAASNIAAEDLLISRKPDKLSLGGPNNDNNLRAESRFRTKASKVKNAFTRVLQISDDHLLELFYNFLGSEYFEKSSLSSQQTFPSLIVKFLGILSGYDSKEAQNTLVEFINYLAANSKYERLVAKLAKEICFLDREPFSMILTKYDELRKYSLKSIRHAELAASKIFEVVGMKVPTYPDLELLCIKEVFAQPGATEDAIDLITALHSHWESLAKQYFAVNFFDLELDPELTLGDSKGSLTITILNAREPKPEIVVSYIDKTSKE